MHRCGGSGGNAIQVLQPESERILEILDKLRGNNVAARSPNREHGRKAGQGEPLFDDVVNEQRPWARKTGGGGGRDQLSGSLAPRLRGSSDGQPQRWISDQKSGIGLLQHRWQVRRSFQEFRRNAPALFAKNASKRLRASRTAVEGDPGHPVKRLF